MTDLQHPGMPTGADSATTPDAKQAVQDEAAQVASAAAEQGKQTASVAAEATTQVTSTAADGAKQVASEAAGQAVEVTKQASEQARQLVEQAQSQLRQQASSSTEKAAGGLRDVGRQVQALSEGRPQEAGPVLDAVRQVADKINGAAGWLDERGFEGAVEDVRYFARRRPGVFLLGAVATGFAAGRLARGMQTANQQQAAGQAPAPLPEPLLPPTGPTGPADPLATVTPPPIDPIAAGAPAFSATPSAVPPLPPASFGGG